MDTGFMSLDNIIKAQFTLSKLGFKEQEQQLSKEVRLYNNIKNNNSNELFLLSTYQFCAKCLILFNYYKIPIT